MARFRRRKWLQRTALLAMAALLWSQFALAGHAGCLDLPDPSAAVAAAVDAGHDHHGRAHDHDHDRDHGHAHGHAHDCNAELPSANKALCDAHCGKDDVSADSGRTPPIPPLLAGAWHPWFAVADIADGSQVAASTWVDLPPRPAWHRPTAHPAALLLI